MVLTCEELPNDEIIKEVEYNDKYLGIKNNEICKTHFTPMLYMQYLMDS